jgi:ABC-type transport system involved in multi-copper enzyme maturation permease subunit
MMALIRSTLLLFSTHLTRVLMTRRMLLCALIALGPAALAVLVLTSEGNPPPPIEVVMYPGWFLLQIVVPATSLLMGSAVISEEIDDRTITYLLTRPFPRAALLLGRWLATAVLLSVLLGGSALLLGWAAASFAPAGAEPVPHDVTTWPLAQMAVFGGAVYSALFAVIGVFLKRPMIIGLAYAFVIEGVLASLPGRSQGLAVVYHLRSYVASQSTHWKELSDELLFELETPAASLAWLSLTLVGALLVGSILITRRQYVLTA